MELRTDRLVLRPWRDSDLAPFAALNADPQVMEYFPALLTRAESDVLAARIRAALDERGWGFWAVEVLEPSAPAGFVGFVGLQPVTFEAPFTPATDLGWRLSRAAWGHGYATEAARAALADWRTRPGLPEAVSFTAVENRRSQAVMRRLGMTRDPDGDFDHPRVPPGHRLRRHVLYRFDPPGLRP